MTPEAQYARLLDVLVVLNEDDERLSPKARAERALRYHAAAKKRGQPSIAKYWKGVYDRAMAELQKQGGGAGGGPADAPSADRPAAKAEPEATTGANAVDDDGPEVTLSDDPSEPDVGSTAAPEPKARKKKPLATGFNAAAKWPKEGEEEYEDDAVLADEQSVDADAKDVDVSGLSPDETRLVQNQKYRERKGNEVADAIETALDMDSTVADVVGTEEKPGTPVEDETPAEGDGTANPEEPTAAGDEEEGDEEEGDEEEGDEEEGDGDASKPKKSGGLLGAIGGVLSSVAGAFGSMASWATGSITGLDSKTLGRAAGMLVFALLGGAAFGGVGVLAGVALAQYFASKGATSQSESSQTYEIRRALYLAEAMVDPAKDPAVQKWTAHVIREVVKGYRQLGKMPPAEVASVLRAAQRNKADLLPQSKGSDAA